MTTVTQTQITDRTNSICEIIGEQICAIIKALFTLEWNSSSPPAPKMTTRNASSSQATRWLPIEDRNKGFITEPLPANEVTQRNIVNLAWFRGEIQS